MKKCTKHRVLCENYVIMMINIAIFASGSGSNAENIIEYFKDSADFNFPLIVSNNSDASVHERAKRLGVKSVTFSKGELLDGNVVIDLLQKQKIDKIVLAGFLLKIPKDIIVAFPNGIINIHPALLPKYGGKGMYGKRVHQAVKDAGETQTGITIHYVNEHYDEGNIIFQTTCSVQPTDSPTDIAEKVHQLEYRYLPKVIEDIWKNGRI